MMLRPPSTMAGDGLATPPAGGAALSEDPIWRTRLHVPLSTLANKDVASDATHDIGADVDLTVNDSASIATADIVNGTGLVITSTAAGVVRLSFDLDAITALNTRRELRLVWVFSVTGGQAGDRVLCTLTDSTTGTYTRSLQLGYKWTGGTDRKARYQVYDGGWTQGDDDVITSSDGQTYRVELNVMGHHARGYVDLASAPADNPEDGTFRRFLNTAESQQSDAEVDPWSSARMARMDIVPAGNTALNITITDFYVLEAA